MSTFCGIIILTFNIIALSIQVSGVESQLKRIALALEKRP